MRRLAGNLAESLMWFDSFVVFYLSVGELARFIGNHLSIAQYYLAISIATSITVSLLLLWKFRGGVMIMFPFVILSMTLAIIPAQLYAVWAVSSIVVYARGVLYRNPGTCDIEEHSELMNMILMLILGMPNLVLSVVLRVVKMASGRGDKGKCYRVRFKVYEFPTNAYAFPVGWYKTCTAITDVLGFLVVFTQVLYRGSSAQVLDMWLCDTARVIQSNRHLSAAAKNFKPFTQLLMMDCCASHALVHGAGSGKEGERDGNADVF